MSDFAMQHGFDKDDKLGLLIFGKNIKKFRIKNKLTQAELAEKIGFSVNFVGMIERGERNTTISNVFKFANALNIKAQELFSDLDSKK